MTHTILSIFQITEKVNVNAPMKTRQCTMLQLALAFIQALVHIRVQWTVHRECTMRCCTQIANGTVLGIFNPDHSNQPCHMVQICLAYCLCFILEAMYLKQDKCNSLYFDSDVIKPTTTRARELHTHTYTFARLLACRHIKCLCEENQAQMVKIL